MNIPLPHHIFISVYVSQNHIIMKKPRPEQQPCHSGGTLFIPSSGWSPPRSPGTLLPPHHTFPHQCSPAHGPSAQSGWGDCRSNRAAASSGRSPGAAILWAEFRRWASANRPPGSARFSGRRYWDGLTLYPSGGENSVVSCSHYDLRSMGLQGPAPVRLPLGVQRRCLL